jgi:hypothetical protein
MPDEEAPRTRPRPWFLVALGLALIALVIYWMYPSAMPGLAPSNAGRDVRPRQTGGRGTAGPAAVDLEALKRPAPEPADAERNPFRFQPKPPPAPPPEEMNPEPAPTLPPAPPLPTGPAPIPLKYLGYIEDRHGKIAGLTDGRGVYEGREGAIIEGRYRIVKIGIESIVMEYVNGTGRQTIPLRGQ